MSGAIFNRVASFGNIMGVKRNGKNLLQTIHSAPSQRGRDSFLQHTHNNGNNNVIFAFFSTGKRDNIYDKLGEKWDFEAYEKQLKELNEERSTLFGASSEEEGNASTSKHSFPPVDDYSHSLDNYDKTAEEKVQDMSETNDEEKGDYEESLEEMKEEREALFGFTNDERDSWAKASKSNYQMAEGSSKNIASALEEHYKREDARKVSADIFTAENLDQTSNHDSSSASSFTHLNESGNDISMVNVGEKGVTKRIAKARTHVIFPPEVMEAFQIYEGDLIGTKGPIFTTAKIAGIMGAKRTSDLIPLCHPLSLDKVDVKISFSDTTPNKVDIECTCNVTGKTGVEMEALTGASIAALTIYDMTKAVSHNIRIEQTYLCDKSGGKRTIVDTVDTSNSI